MKHYPMIYGPMIRVHGQDRHLLKLRNGNSILPLDAHPLVDRLNETYGINLRVISPQVADAALSILEFRLNAGCNLGMVTDALIAYERPGKKLGNQITYDSDSQKSVLVLPTGRYQGEKNVALVGLDLSSRDFVKDGKHTIVNVSDERLILVPKFPSNGYGQRMPYAETMVPHGKKVGDVRDPQSKIPADPDCQRRSLLRTGYSYVGILTMSQDIYGSTVVNATDSNLQGLVVEVPESETAKISKILKTTEGLHNFGLTR